MFLSVCLSPGSVCLLFLQSFSSLNVWSSASFTLISITRIYRQAFLCVLVFHPFVLPSHLENCEGRKRKEEGREELQVSGSDIRINDEGVKHNWKREASHLKGSRLLKKTILTLETHSYQPLKVNCSQEAFMTVGKTIYSASSSPVFTMKKTSKGKMTCIPSLASSCVFLVFLLLLLPSSSSGHALCPIRCTCDENKLSVDCKEASLDLVPITLNPSILELYLPRNNIKSITSALHFYRKLLFLDLSGNSLTSLDSGNFISQKALKVLILNINKISSLDPGCFQGLENLRILSLSANSLKGLSRNSLTPLKHLEKLDLSKNDLMSEALHPLSFDSMKHTLKTLDLSHNAMTFLPEKAFHGLSNLSTLNLAFNSIGRNIEEEGILRNNSFVHLTSLTELNLESNQIHSLESHAFHGLENSLESLDLSSNHLEIIPTTALSLLSKLTKLSISRNRIMYLTNNCLYGLTNLKIFILKNDDNLKSIEVDAFSSNPLLEKVSLDYCPNLKVLHEETFLVQRQDSLKQVSLRANGLTKLPRHLLEWSSLQSLDVRGNPFNCSDTCFVHWLAAVLHGNNNNSISEESMRETLCHDPAEWKGHELASVPVACYEDHPQQHQQSESGDDPSTTTVESTGDTMSTVIVSALSFSTLICAGTFALTLYCFLRRRKERLAESRLKEYFAASLLNHQQHSYRMSSGQHPYDSFSHHQLHQTQQSLQHYQSSPLHHDSYGQQEHDLILKKEDDDGSNNLHNEYYYASLTSSTTGQTGLTSAGPVSASYETSNGHRLYENHYQELLEPSLNNGSNGVLVSVTTPLLNSSSSTPNKTHNKNTRSNSGQRNHHHAVSSSSFLTSSPASSSVTSSSTSSTSCYPTTTSSSISPSSYPSSYPEANPYATSIVIQHPIKINSNLYRV